MKPVKFLFLIGAILGIAFFSFAEGAADFSPGKARANPEFPTDDPAYSAMWHAVVHFGSVSVSRPQLLAEFQGILTNYPGSQYEQRARRTVEILTRMIAEDEAHAKTAPLEVDGLPVDERVAREYIFQLREQNGRQFFQPGRCDVFNDPRGTNTAAHELARIGYPAVPQLIAALDDDTFTRSVGYWRNFAFSHTVLTVGDCAEAILERISGRCFYQPASTSGYMSNENKNSATRQAYEAWWSEFQKKGEEQMLAEGTEAGDRSAPMQAEYLVVRYPKSAQAPLIKGIQSSKGDEVKARLIRLLGRFDSPEAIAFLDQEMRQGIDTPSTAAATVLERKGRPEAVTVMIQEWEKSPSIGSENMTGANALVQFLAESDSPEAIDALGLNLRKAALNTRMAVVESVGEGLLRSTYPDVTNFPAATQEACERLLVTALQDSGVGMGETGSRMGKNYADPRVCDMAGYFLNQKWPKRYDFDLAASPKTRDNQRIECQNVWRRDHGQPLLLLPKPGRHVPAFEASKVTVIEWDADTVKPSEAFAARVESFRNKMFNGTNVADLLVDYSSHPEAGTMGMVFTARKDEDLTGVKLSIYLLPGTAQNPKDDWKFSESAVVGQKAIDSRGGGVWATEERSWEVLCADIRTAVGASPETPFVINVRLVSKKH